MTPITMSNSIQLIAVDIDGTLLNSQSALSPRVEKTLQAALAKGVRVVLATGKTYPSARKVISALGLTTPGIFVQGTVIMGNDGEIRQQQALDASLARQIITFAEDRGFHMSVYTGKRILARTMTDRIEKLSRQYDEPIAEVVGPLQNILDNVPVNKLLAHSAGDARAIKRLRWQLGMQINGGARLLQAGIDDMLEVLPTGASKGAALKLLLRDMKIPTEAVLALGDAENDIEMLQMAGIGVAMGNAHQSVKDVADYVVGSNDADGVAEAVERFVLAEAESPSAAVLESAAAANQTSEVQE